MNYYYDVLLNYQEIYYMFYEWDKNDELTLCKKIPLIHVDSNTLLDFMFKKVEVDKLFLNTIYNKCKIRGNKYLKYNAIFSDGKNSLALEFNENGENINKSSLYLDDEININDFIYGIGITKINYKIIKKDIISKESRKEEKIKKLLNIEIDNIYENKNNSKLKYLYLEWFNEYSDNIDDIYKKMKNKLKSRLSKNEIRIYEIIKMSYNNV